MSVARAAPSSPEAIEAALRALLGDGVAAAAAVCSPVDDQLYPEERDHIARAVAVRRAEWGTARVCARRALAQLGVASTPLLPNPDRSPSWPPGVVGSLSHAGGLCAAVAAESQRVRALGVDMEPAAPLEADLEPLICTPRERRAIATRRDGARGLLGKMVFCAKEAVYKCQYALNPQVIDFLDVELAIDGGSCGFEVAWLSDRVRPDLGLNRIRGRLAVIGKVLLATASLPGAG